MNLCPRCGTPAYEEDAYCGACGFNLQGETATAGVTQKELNVDDIRMNLGVVYFKMGKYAQAVDVFNKVLNDNPDNLLALDWRQKALEQQRSATAKP